MTIHLVTDHAHDDPDPADPTAGLRCPTCGRQPRVDVLPPERSPPCDAEAEITCCQHYAHGASFTTAGAAAHAARGWVRLFRVDEAGGDVEPEPEP